MSGLIKNKNRDPNQGEICVKQTIIVDFFKVCKKLKGELTITTTMHETWVKVPKY